MSATVVSGKRLEASVIHGSKDVNKFRRTSEKHTEQTLETKTGTGCDIISKNC
jgi:hypothetical protein